MPQASGPAAVWKMQSSLMKPISASMSWAFQAALKASNVAVVTGALLELMGDASVFDRSSVDKPLHAR